jgi:hypothetical protein
MRARTETSGSKLLLAFALAALPIGCLPGDTRPTPQSIYVTAEPSQAIALGLETADGWRVTFDRFVMALGNTDFEDEDETGGACTSYAEAHYDRLFDFTVSGREKVGTIYGLGTCRVEFRMRSPSSDTLLGPGVTEIDRELMRIRASDRFVEDERVSTAVIGEGSRGGETKRFEWVFRRSYELTNCKAEDGSLLTTLALSEGGASELRIEVRPEELFRSIADDEADFWFQPIADADADADAMVTMDELAKVMIPAVDAGDSMAADKAESAEVSLEHRIYAENLPRLLRILGGGACEAEERGGRR